MNVTEKVLRLQNSSPAIARLGLPAYEWWSEALHGVAGSPGVSFARDGDFSCATSFPEPIGLGATFDRQLIRALASVTSTEARAFNNQNRAGLDFWSPPHTAPHSFICVSRSLSLPSSLLHHSTHRLTTLSPLALLPSLIQDSQYQYLQVQTRLHTSARCSE